MLKWHKNQNKETAQQSATTMWHLFLSAILSGFLSMCAMCVCVSECAFSDIYVQLAILFAVQCTAKIAHEVHHDLHLLLHWEQRNGIKLVTKQYINA